MPIPETYAYPEDLAIGTVGERIEVTWVLGHEIRGIRHGKREVDVTAHLGDRPTLLADDGGGIEANPEHTTREVAHVGR